MGSAWIGALFLLTSSALNAAVLTVPLDAPSVQAAIELAAPGDEILVSPGIYPGGLDFLGKAVVVRSSGGALVTTIDAQGAGPVVRFDNGETESSVLDGFTLTGGTGENLAPGLTTGGGIFVVDASPDIRRCRVRANTADNGGGVAISGTSSVSFFQCAFEFNVAMFAGGGVSVEESASPEFLECEFTSNSALTGGGAWAHLSQPTFRESLFVGNTAGLVGGAICMVSATTQVLGTRFDQNGAQNGGALLVDEAVLTCRRSTFFQNGAQAFGAAIRAQGASDLLVQNCTLAHNSAIQGGGGIDVSDPAVTVTIHNSVIFWNGPDQLEPDVPANAEVDYTAIQGGYPTGEGNHGLDPLFGSDDVPDDGS
ncbi:MAG: hypothetical protein KDC38_21095, partial [Planctomycetes bacterium]|nr:hypothetical protein [Planctomycetota bacterium]